MEVRPERSSDPGFVISTVQVVNGGGALYSFVLMVNAVSVTGFPSTILYEYSRENTGPTKLKMSDFRISLYTPDVDILNAKSDSF